jgi:hypothetical protein
LLDGPDRGFGAAAQAKLAEDVGDVKLDGSLAKHQLVRDLSIAPAPRQEPQDVALAGR